MQHNEAWRDSALLCSPLQPNAHHLTSKMCLQADEAGTAGRQLASTLAAVTALTSAALMPAMALALAASHTRQAIAGVCLATAGLSWAALPAVWTWLAARSGPAADRMQKFVAAPGPVARRRGQAPAQQGEVPCFGRRVCGDPASFHGQFVGGALYMDTGLSMAGRACEPPCQGCGTLSRCPVAACQSAGARGVASCVLAVAVAVACRLHSACGCRRLHCTLMHIAAMARTRLVPCHKCLTGDPACRRGQRW